MVSPSIKDVADLAGVSVGTVSNVLNHPERVAPGTLAEVNRTIEELGYVPNDVARHLRAGQSNTLGMIVPDITNPFFTGILRGVEDAADDINLSLIVGDSGESKIRQDSHVDVFEKQRIRGLLISPVGTIPERVIQAHRRGTPVVLVDFDGRQFGISSVSVDDVSGGFTATKHLLDSGARRIAFLAGLFGYQQVVDRLRGAEIALEGFPDATLEIIRAADNSALAGRRAAEGIVHRSRADRPEAIFAANDMLALGVLQVFSLSSDLRVPDDLLIVGYDDIEFAEAAIVPLSSMRQPADVIGRTSLTLLHERMENPSIPPRNITFEPELVRRASS